MDKYGGIIIGKEMLLTEELTWLENIQSNRYINRASIGAIPQYFGFYSPDLSSRRKRERLGGDGPNAEKFAIRFPNL